MDSLFSEYERALGWRRPAPLWAALGCLVALGFPALFLLPEGGFGQLTLAAAVCGFGAAFLWILTLSAMGRPPLSRRDIVSLVLRFGAVAALLAPFLFQALLDAMEGIEAPNGPNGLPGALPLALAPLSLIVGLPLFLFSGFVFSCLAFERREPEPFF